MSANMPQDLEQSFAVALFPDKRDARSPLQYPQSPVEYPKGRITLSWDEPVVIELIQLDTMFGIDETHDTL